MEAAEASPHMEEGSEPGNYLYETLDPFSFFDTNISQNYSVYRNEITSSPGPSSATAAVDYFSLEVRGEHDNDENKDEKPSTPRGSDDGSRKQASDSAWFRSGSRFKSPMLQLHQEILDFTKFISPTPEEQASRSAAVERVFEVIKYIWPHCNVEVFGSFRTGLYLPTSDIDAVILDSKVKTPQIGLRALARALSQRNIAKKIQVIAKARVPIIKFVEGQSGVAFDVSFDVDNGPKAADYIKDAVSRIPALRPLCLLLKVFLQQRELNEVFSGGIGSYALLAMLIAQLQIYWNNQQLSSSNMSVEHNLGILLVDFFDLYGRKINIWDVGISCNLAGTFFLKSSRGFLNEERPYLLSIEDPQAPDNDIGRNSYNYFKVKSAFSMAYSSLTDAKTIISLGPNRSILGTIIRADPMLLERKGACGSELNLDNLLSSAAEPMSEQFSDGHTLYNWRLVDEDPFPRGEVVHEHVSSSKKKKGLKLKYRADESAHGNTSDQQASSEEYGRKETREKKRRKGLKGSSPTNGS